MKPIQLLFASVNAAVVAIPGMNLFGTDAWWPPGDGDVIFRIVAIVVGSGVLLLMLLARARVAAIPPRRAGIACATGLVLALILLFSYFAALRRAVLDYTWSTTTGEMLVPFRIGRWASPELLQVVQAVPEPGVPPPGAKEEITKADLKRVIEQGRFGPDVVHRYIPESEVTKTTGILLLLYCTCMGLIVATFMTISIRLGYSGLDADEDEPATNPAPG